MSTLALRTVSGIVMAAVFLAAIYFGGWFFAALMCFVSLVIWFEWTQINLPDADDRLFLFGIIALILLMFLSVSLSGVWEAFALIAVSVGALAAGLKLGGGGKYAAIGLAYAGLFFLAMTQLRGEAGNAAGFSAIIYLCAVVWATDIGAYFAGRAIGGPKLARAISPNKTMSGAAGGVLCAMFFAGIFAAIDGLSPVFGLVLLAAVLSVISQAGDLYESWLKRKAGVKDSGSIIPGHGGVMDRVDGLVFAAISLWIISAIFGNLAVPAERFFG